MPLPRFLASNPAVRATTTAARLIWQSKIMTLGVACELLAVIAAVVNWVTNLWWLPNAALTLATLGAVAVATKIAWDYHGRGLNAQQRQDVDGILTDASLNEKQRNEIAAAIKSSGLTAFQKIDLETALYETTAVANAAEAQTAVAAATHYLSRQRPDHAHVVVIYTIGVGRLDIRYVDPPRPEGACQRQHAYESGDDLNFVTIAISLFRGFTNPAVLWKHPGNRRICYTNYNDIVEPGHELIFSFEDCVPKWRLPTTGDYVLKHDALNGSAWEQQP